MLYNIYINVQDTERKINMTRKKFVTFTLASLIVLSASVTASAATSTGCSYSVSTSTASTSYDTNTTNTAGISESMGWGSGCKMEANSSVSIRLSWNKNFKADGYIIEQYKDNKWTRIKKITNADTLKFSVKGLASGTDYEFRVKAYSNTDGKITYTTSDTISACTKPSKPAAKTEATSSVSVRLTWDKVNGADGYIIQQYKNGEWVRIKKTLNPETLKYSIGGLSSGTTYKFRVQAYRIKDGKPYYSAFSSVIVTTTKPKAPVIRTAPIDSNGTSTDSKEDEENKKLFGIEWDKVSGASGYIVQQKINGKWERVKKITTPTTTNYIFDYTDIYNSLTVNTTYGTSFRVQAYKILNGKVYYGAFSDKITMSCGITVNYS